MSYYQDPRDQYYNNQSGPYQGEYAGGYQQGQEPGDQYYDNQSGPYQGEYAGGYQQGQLANDDYRPSNNNPYPTPNSGGRAANDDDNASVNSSIYSQPSVAGMTPSNNMRYYQEQYLETTEPYNEYDYPPSPFADSTNTHNSATGLTTSNQQGLPINEKNYMDENNYHNSSQDTQPQFDVYKDFNNRGDETYDEESRHDTLTGSDGAHDHTSPSNGKGNRQSTSGEHYVVNPKKERRCAFCSRKTCVIITFIILVLLAAGMYFVWPRTPEIQFLESKTIGDAEITLKPAVVKMGMELKFELDNRENWLPYKFNSLDINIFDAGNSGTFDKSIGTGSLKDFPVQGRAKTTVSIPVSFYYEGSAQNDPVLQSFIGGCTQPQENEKKSTLKFRVETTMFIMGLDWVKKPKVTITISDFECPFNVARPLPDAEQSAPQTEQPAPPANPSPSPSPSSAPAPEQTPAPADPAQAPANPPPTADPAPAPANPPPAADPAPAQDPPPKLPTPVTPPNQPEDAPPEEPATPETPPEEPAADPADNGDNGDGGGV